MTDDALEAYAAHAALFLDLTPSPESLAAVVANLRILRAMAAQFADLPLDDRLEPAPVLRL